MTSSDRQILEFLQNDGNQIRATPRTIAANIDYKPNTVRKRVGKLREVDLVEYYDETGGIYQLAELGERYLRDDLSEEEVADLEEQYGRAGESND